jgi:RNA polymerase sigma-70 factor (ECF subfamily)
MPSHGSSTFGHLLDKARAGDNSAQGRLLQAHRSWLKRMAHRWLPGRVARKADASDVVQDCLQQAHQKLGQFRGADARAFRSWLATTLRNLINKVIRSETPRIARESPLPIDPSGEVSLRATHIPVIQKLVCDADVQWMRRALEELTEPERRLIEMRFFEDLSYEQLAERLGQSATKEEQAKLRQRAHRLLERLQVGISLLRVVESFPPHYRKVLCRRHFRGWSQERIATEMGCHPEAVGRWLREARQRLPADLGEYL